MKIKDCKFMISAVSKSQYPNENLPEIAFSGRSNVGKSSLINSLLNRKKLVKVSSNPGKTRTINFFMVNIESTELMSHMDGSDKKGKTDKGLNEVNLSRELILVDLPGYGYAAVSKSEKLKWASMIEDYLTKRENLKSVVLLVDIRHKPTNDDKMMYDFLKYYRQKVIIVATKRDKISNNALKKNIKLIRETLGSDEKDVIIPYSSEKHTGREELWKEIVRSI